MRCILWAVFAALSIPAIGTAQDDPCSGDQTVTNSFSCLYAIFPRGAGDDTIGAALADEMSASGETGEISSDGPLMIVNGYGVFVYDGSGADAGTRLASTLTRSDPDTGFVQMTALSHVGPAVAYLAALAQAEADSYPDPRDALLDRIRAARTALQDRFGIDHATLELECAAHICHETSKFGRDHKQDAAQSEAAG